MIIYRPDEIRSVSGARKWTLVYGRRKTGKTFIVENYVKYDLYFFVNRDTTILSKTDNRLLSYEVFVELLTAKLAAGGTVVVDEFHRLGGRFFDLLHSMKKNGKLIVLTSTLFLVSRHISANSPLLGLFHEVRIPIISLNDCLASLKHIDNKKELMELAVVLREPLVAEQFSGEGTARRLLAEVLIGSVKTVPALIGEIFTEEERSISAIYEGIMRAVASGKVVSGEISSSLFSKGLIGKDDPSVIQQHMDNLIRLGILSRVPVYGKKKFVYKMQSPLMRLFYYADERYGISERKLGKGEAGRIVDEIMPRIVEDNVRELLAERLGLGEAVAESGDFEIDGLLLRFKEPAAGVEVKWGKRVGEDDIRKAEANLGRFKLERRILFVPDKKMLKTDSLEVMDPSDLRAKQ
jgi:hypothetical protein